MSCARKHELGVALYAVQVLERVKRLEKRSVRRIFAPEDTIEISRSEHAELVRELQELIGLATPEEDMDGKAAN